MTESPQTTGGSVDAGDEIEELTQLVKRNGALIRKAALPAIGAAALAAFFIARSRKGKDKGGPAAE